MRVSAAFRAMSLPVATSPVTETMATFGLRHQRVADGLALAGDHVEHAGREDVGRDLGELQRGERRELGRLEDERVAGGQRRAELPRRHVERVVPRGDADGHAERVAAQERGVVLDVVAAGLGLQGAGRAGEEPHVVDGEVELELDDRHRLADVGHLERLELVEVGLDRVGQGEQLLGPLARRGLAPGLEGVVGPRRPPPRHRRPRSTPPRRCTSPVAGFEHGVGGAVLAATH